MKHGEGWTVAAVVAAMAMMLGAGGALAQEASNPEVNVTSCTNAYQESDAYDECGVAAGYDAAVVTIQAVRSNNRVTNWCRVSVGCPRTTTSDGTQTTTENSTGFSGNLDSMRSLRNDNGVLRKRVPGS